MRNKALRVQSLRPWAAYKSLNLSLGIISHTSQRVIRMKISIAAPFFVIISALFACAEPAPTIDELVENDELYEQIKSECKMLGSKEEQFKIETCLNMHKAADKRKAIIKELPSLLGNK